MHTTLCCYLMVASIASAHAFSVPDFSNASTAVGVISMADMSADDDCHSEVGAAGAETMSLCKMFCDAMSMALVSKQDVHILAIAPRSVHAVIDQQRYMRALRVEQQPPK